MNKQIQIITELAILIALSLIFDLLSSMYLKFGWLNGGSISIAMLPIMIASYRHGVKNGLLAGLAVGAIQLMWGTNYGPISIILDYILAYTVVGLAGLFVNKDKKTIKPSLFIVSILLIYILRLSCHVLSGVLVFSVDFWGSLIYNIGYVSISTAASGILLFVLIKKAPMLVFKEEVI